MKKSIIYLLFLIMSTYGFGNPIHDAVIKRNLLEVKRLIEEEKVDPSTPSPSLKTPLHFATGRNYPEIVEYLISKEANINAQDQNGETPLLVAAFYGHSDILNHLLKQREIKIDIPNTDLSTPLHKAAQKNRFMIIQALINAGATVDVYNQQGFSPIDLAAFLGNLEAIKQFLEFEADPTRALAFATLEGSPFITTLSKFYQKEDPVTENDMILLSRVEEIVKLLLQYGADINNTEVFPQEEETPYTIGDSAKAHDYNHGELFQHTGLFSETDNNLYQFFKKHAKLYKKRQLLKKMVETIKTEHEPLKFEAIYVQETCPVCLEKMDAEEQNRNIALYPCGHTLHLDCFEKLLLTTDACPLCRTSIKSIELLSQAQADKWAVQEKKQKQKPKTPVGKEAEEVVAIVLRALPGGAFLVKVDNSEKRKICSLSEDLNEQDIVPGESKVTVHTPEGKRAVIVAVIKK